MSENHSSTSSGFVIKIFTPERGPSTVRGMSGSNLQARRATVDDLVELRRLWHQAGAAAPELEQQIRYFQIVETADGVFLGALALFTEGQQGWLHSEYYGQTEWAGEARLRLWERVQAMARNHGLYRIWTQEDDPFWRSSGFEEPTPELLGRRPLSFGTSEQPWRVLVLREEATAKEALESEFDLFAATQRGSAERLAEQIRTFRMFAYALLIFVVIGAIILVVIAMMPGSSWSRFRKSQPPVSAPADGR
jgi:N-acetylglutamate synthase-like GNAT family acetyltransferase